MMKKSELRKIIREEILNLNEAEMSFSGRITNDDRTNKYHEHESNMNLDQTIDFVLFNHNHLFNKDEGSIRKKLTKLKPGKEYNFSKAAHGQDIYVKRKN